MAVSYEQARTAAPSSVRNEALAQALVLLALFVVPAFECLRTANVNDPDIWWHLRTGEWIAQHHVIPHVDLYATPTIGQPWQDYSWLFELGVFHLFHRFGPMGVVVYTVGMLVIISMLVWRLMRSLQGDFTIAAALTLTTCLLLSRLYTPRPWLLSIALFVLELDILMRARCRGDMRGLIALPPLFALWANLHIQFIDGLVVLFIALAESLLPQRLLRHAPERIPPLPLASALAASLLATLVNPYGWHIYRTAHDLATQPGALNWVAELQALDFRSIADFALLLFVLAAVALLARSRELPVFESLLLLFAVYVSFRSRRDLWVVAIVAAMILASTIKARSTPQLLPAFATPLIAAAASAVLFLAARPLHINRGELDKRLADSLPVHAVEAARARHYAGPVYCNYDWGGYLIWTLRLPVSIDGRASVHGDERMTRSQTSWNGRPDWADDPLLRSAGLIVAPDETPLNQLLRLDPRFKLVYEDKQASLFIPSSE